MVKPLKVACFGEVMIELMIDALPADAKANIAGDSFNTAVYMRRLLDAAHSVDYVTALGDERLSDKMAQAIAEHDIGTNHIGRIKGKLPGLYSITLDAHGERGFSYWRSASAARGMFETGDGPDFQCLQGFDVIYASGISLAILPDPTRLAFFEWLKGFRKDGGRFAFDSNYRPALWESRALAAQRTDMAWKLCDIALPSLDDEMALFGETEHDVTARFNGYRHANGAIKRGSRGPRLLGGDDAPNQSYPVVTNVVDTTAAGDSFSGAFLATFLNSADAGKAAMAGHQLASAVIQSKGAIVQTAR